jgi:hypothetical protein
LIKEKTKFRVEELKMKKFAILSFIFLGIFTVYFGENVLADEKDAARVPLENYLKGHATGNPEFIRQAFHKDARIMAFRDDKLLNLSVEEFAGRFNGKAADDEAQRKRAIESLDISGNAAIAKIVLDYPTVKFVDYMTLLKIDGEWKIVNKTFFAESRNNTPEKVNSKSAVETTLETFMRATKTGESELLKQTLHEEGNQKYVENNKYSSKTYPEFLAQFEKVRKGKPADDDKNRKRKIKSIEISGNAAVAKLISDYPDAKYFEYLVLLKIGNEWKIVNNVFYGEPKPKQNSEF